MSYRADHIAAHLALRERRWEVAPVLSNLTNPVTATALERGRTGVCLLPVIGGFQGTAVSSGTRLASLMTKNDAGVAGYPGSPTWSPPV